MPYPPTTTPITSSAPVTSSLVPPIPTPTYGPSGSFAVHAQTHIRAPPHKVLSLIRDTNSWKEWNTFCPSVSLSLSPAPTQKKTTDSDPNIPTGNSGWLELGTIGTIDVFMSGDGLVEGKKRSRTQGMIVTHLEPIAPSSTSASPSKTGYRLAWKGTGWSHWQLHSERVMEFVELELENGEIETEFSCWETFGGVLGPVVKATVGGTLVERFGDYQRDVKTYLENGKGEVGT